MLHSLHQLIMHPLLILCLISLPAASVADCDNPIYKRFSANHTACREENVKCNKTKVSSTAWESRLLIQSFFTFPQTFDRSEFQNKKFKKFCAFTMNIDSVLHQELN